MTDDELDAGVPLQRPVGAHRTAEAGRSQAKPAVQQNPTRFISGDDEQAGVPLQVPGDARPVDSVFDPALKESDIVLLEEKINESESRDYGKLIFSPLFFSVIVLFIAGFAIVILSQVLQFILAIQAAPFFVQAVASVCVALPAVAFCIALARLVVAYHRLAVTPKVDSDVIRQPLKRAVTRHQVARQVEAGYNSLKTIVRDYPIEDKHHIRLLERCGLDANEVDTLKSNISTLLHPEYIGQSQWIADCEQLFVSIIDTAAKRRVTDYAKSVGYKTAISPFGLVDALIVCTNAVLMVEDLCRLYGVRAGRLDSVLLTGRIFYTTFVSGKLDEAIDSVADSFFDGALTSVPQSLSIGVLKRVAEGGTNIILFYRLGMATVNSLRPITFRKQ